MKSSSPESSVTTSTSEVVLKTRTGKIKTTAETLSECDCEKFDSFLSGRWKSDIDKKGRRKLRLDFDDKVFRHTLSSMQLGISSVPPSFDAVRVQEQQRQFQFLCHRPTLNAAAAAFEAEQAAAIAAAAAAEAARHTPAGFVRIEAGEFLMGAPEHEAGRRDNESLRRVNLTRAFWYQSTPVTQGQWQSLMGSNPSRFNADSAYPKSVYGESASERPVERVNWYEAVAYCNALSTREGLSPYYDMIGSAGRPGTASWVNPSRVSVLTSGINSYRLPSEAEQQRARRGSDAQTASHATYASAGTALGDIAWYGDNAGGGTHPVGRLVATNEGVHDALGNVFEWSNDWYASELAAAGANGKLSDPVGPDAGTRRVIGGGGWHSMARVVRAAYRESADPTHTNIADLGFRPARFVSPPSGPLNR